MEEYLGNEKAVNKIKPLVSVCVMTYRHAKFIEQCLDSILAQQTNFPFEIIVGEDDSPDDTRAICKRYAEQYPDKIRLFLRSREDVIFINGLPTGRFNFMENIKATRGKYIALCEGDDYWTDKQKLQMQVDFLEQNPDYSMCFTDVEVVKEMEIDDYHKPAVKADYSMEDFVLHGYFIMTPTLVFRKIFDEFPEFFRKVLWGDIALALLLADKGKGRYFDMPTAAYRRHTASLSQQNDNRDYVKYSSVLFEIFDAFNDYTDRRHHSIIRKKLFPLSKKLLMYGSRDMVADQRRRHIKRMIKGYNKYRNGLNVKEISYYSLVLFFPKLIRAYQQIFAKNKEIV